MDTGLPEYKLQAFCKNKNKKKTPAKHLKVQMPAKNIDSRGIYVGFIKKK